MRYINADKYKADLLIGQEYLDEDTLLTAINLLDCQPTADVIEVRHGRWAEQLDGTHYCSECGHDATYTYDGTEIWGVACPFCGAIMDEKER